jgi:ribosomal protein L11 methyltransferase
MPWLQLSVTAADDQAPLVEVLLENLGALSVTLGDADDHPILEPPPGHRQLWPQTRITALFEADRDPQQLDARLRAALPAGVTRTLALERVEDRAWERAWMDDFRPMRFGTRLWVCPRGLPPRDGDTVTLALDPGLAFGTGTHPTTALCLEWLDGATLEGCTVIDYGCGSGILAIAALLLGASSAIAVDHDPQALEATLNNAASNGVERRLRVYLPGQMPDGAAQVLLANILAAPLIELADTLAERVEPGGPIVLSGILSEQSEAVASAYRRHFAMGLPVARDGWVRLEGVRHSGSRDG